MLEGQTNIFEMLYPTFDGKMNRDTDGFEMLEILDKVGDEISK